MIANLLPPLAHGVFRFILKRILFQYFYVVIPNMQKLNSFEVA